MKIALASSSCHKTPPDAYGSEVTTWYLAEELAKRGHEVHLFAAEGSRTPPGGALYTMPLNLLDATPEKLSALQNLYRISHCDLVHDASSSHAFADASHDIGHDKHLATINGISFLTPRCKHNVVVLSEAARQAALHGTPAWGLDYPKMVTNPGTLPDGVVVHYGTDTEFYNMGDHLGDYVIYIGRPHLSKGVHLIIEIAKKMPEQEFILAWRAEYPEHLEYEAKYISDVSDMGNVQIVQIPRENHHEMKRELYRQAKAFLQPTVYLEAFGLTAIEALACGTPVILANKGSAPEIVRQGETGFLCSTLEEYCEAIRSIRTIDNYRCRDDAIERFDKAVMCARYLYLYGKVLEGREW